MNNLHLLGLLAVVGAGVPLGCGSDDSTDLGNGSGGSAATGNTGNTGSGGTAGTPAGGGGSAGTPAGGGAGGNTGGAGGGGGGPTGTVKFVAIGDTGKGNTGQQQVADAIEAKCAASGCDFVQLLGDNIYESGVSSVDDPQWQDKFEIPYANIPLPFWVVLGNHDNGGNGTGNEFWKGDVEVQYSLKTQKWKLPARYYVHQEPGVDFFNLDTNAAMFSQHAAQKTDLSAWLPASTAKWKITFGHHPYLSNGPHGNAGSYEGLPFVPGVNGAGVKDLLDSTICGKTDVYICGHDHSRQWLQGNCNGTELIVSGAGASPTDLPGSNPTYFQANTLGFLYVVIDSNTFTGEFYDANGNMEFSRTITK